MSQENVEILYRFATAASAGDLATFVELTHPSVEWHTSLSVISAGGTYHGHEGLRQSVSDIDEAFEVFRSFWTTCSEWAIWFSGSGISPTAARRAAFAKRAVRLARSVPRGSCHLSAGVPKIPNEALEAWGCRSRRCRRRTWRSCRAWTEAFNRRDMEALADLASPSFELVPYLSSMIETTTYRGHDGLRKYFEDADFREKHAGESRNFLRGKKHVEPAFTSFSRSTRPCQIFRPRSEALFDCEPGLPPGHDRKRLPDRWRFPARRSPLTSGWPRPRRRASDLVPRSATDLRRHPRFARHPPSPPQSR